MKRLLLLLCALSIPVFGASAKKSYTLFENGKSDYTIVISSDASTSVHFAAEELQYWLEQVSGIRIPISTDKKASGKTRYLVVGQALPDNPCTETKDSFCWRSSAGNIYLWGGSDRGTLYATYSFLKENFGCRWYTSSISVAPKADTWTFQTLNQSEIPKILMRDNFWFDAFDPLWAVRNRSTHVASADSELVRKLGGGEGIDGCHTLGNFYITYEKYLDSHPEYFSLIDGKRSRDYAQVCLSNPEVLQIVIDGVRERMRKYPEKHIFDVSQNDNYEYCRCENCQALTRRFGGRESGTMLWFVNQVADAIKDEFPDNFVSTFAYQYTRSVPENIKPADNVVIRLCGVEECQLHEIDSCDFNRAFVRDLEDWSRIAPRLCIWDYVGSYRHYLAPMPNLRTFQSRIRAFCENGAISVMPQGNYQSVGSIFDEMKAYVTASLLWDPYCDEIAVEDDFLDGVFGPAAPAIREYLDYERSAIIAGDKHQTGFLELDGDFYPDGFEERGREIFKAAYAAVGEDSTLRYRVERAELPLCYLKLARNPRVGVETGALDLFRRVVAKSGVTHYKEGTELAKTEVFLQEMRTAPLMSTDPGDCGDIKIEGAGLWFHFKRADADGIKLISRSFKGWNGRSSVYMFVSEEAGGHPHACYRLSGSVTPGSRCEGISDCSWNQGEIDLSGFDPQTDYTIAVSEISPDRIVFSIVPVDSLLDRSVFKQETQSARRN